MSNTFYHFDPVRVREDEPYRMSVVKDIVDMHVKSERCLQHLLRFLNCAPPSQEVLLYKNEDFEILNHLGKIGIFKSDTGVRKDLKTSVLRYLTQNAVVTLNLPDEFAMSRKFYTKVLMPEALRYGVSRLFVVDGEAARYLVFHGLTHLESSCEHCYSNRHFSPNTSDVSDD